MRVLRLEHESLRANNVDIAPFSILRSVAVSSSSISISSETEAKRNDCICHVARLRASVAIPRSHRAVWAALYSITGGLGGLGLRAATMLLEAGALAVVLSSRSGRMALGGCTRHAHVGWPTFQVAASEVGDAADAFSCVGHSARIGVLHAAGVLRDGLLRFVAAHGLHTVFAPKALGASHVQQVGACHSLEAFGLFSSVSSAFGNVGQATYAAANAYLDALAPSHRLCGRVSSSLQIPAVGGAGMAVLAGAYGAVDGAADERTPPGLGS